MTYGSENLKRADAFYGFKVADGWYGSVGGFYRVSDGVRDPGFGAVVSFELADAQTVDRACAAIKIIWNATSLGGVEPTMERRSVHPGQEHIPDGLIRMSVGCEDVEDLWADLEQALAT